VGPPLPENTAGLEKDNGVNHRGEGRACRGRERERERERERQREMSGTFRI